jgi:hypothetical protein
MKTAESYGIMQKNGRFIVTKDGNPLQLPKSDGQNIITEFDTKEDAQKYLDILKSLKRRSHR